VPGGAWFVRAGRLLLTSSSDGGDELSCRMRTRGSLVGLEALRGAAADYEAWTVEPSQLCHVGAEQARAWLGEPESPAHALLELALDEVTRAREESVALAGGAVERVARFLFTRTAGEPLAIEQQLFARMLRMRPETLSRALKRLRTAGAVAKGRTVRVLDSRRLAQIVAR
jgi:CRP-like cAMP-binding protein